ncbi:MAG: hypothetical protein ABI398_10530 [Devosia sp.]
MKSLILAAAAALTMSPLPALASESFDLGGAAKGSPSTVAYQFGGEDAVAVFVRGPGDLMYANVGTEVGAEWTDWTPIGTLALKGDPSCTARSTSRIDCTGVGPNNNLYWTSYDAKANKWTGWANIGGAATNDPSIVKTSEGGKTQLRIFVRGPLNHLFMNSLVNGSWSDWKDLKGVVGTSVSCARVFKLGAHCYDSSANSVLQLDDVTHKTGTDVVTEKLGGLVTGRVSAVGNDWALRVFVNGPGQKLWINTWDKGWSDWQQTDVTMSSSPGCDVDSTGTIGWCANVTPSGSVTMNALLDGEI